QETLNIKSNIGRAKVLGTMICICGALVLTLYKGTALTQQNAQMQTQTSNSSPTAGIVGSGLCYVGISWCLQQRGPVFTSSFIPLIQVFAAIFSFFFLDEQIYCGR
ncbi:hypothetical protein F2Q70_00032057, partial [Brassica cretica]